MADIRTLIADDAYAMTFQSLGQYRSALLAALSAAPQPAQAVPDAEQKESSPTAGMNMAQRILHVGGRNNAAGYVEFGSVQAVEALVRQVLRDLPELAELERLRKDVAVYREAAAMRLSAAPAAPQPARCPQCNYQHGHQIGCENNPVDIALKAQGSKDLP